MVFSKITGEASCNHEYVGGLERGPHEEAEPFVALRQAPGPGIRVEADPALIRVAGHLGSQVGSARDSCGNRF